MNCSDLTQLGWPAAVAITAVTLAVGWIMTTLIKAV